MLAYMHTRLWTACLVGAMTFASLPSGSLVTPRHAHAAVAVAHTLEELVDQSPWVIVGTAMERQSVWEHVGGSKRIVTYTKLKVNETVYGKNVGKTLWVRTLGGAVGKIGQAVAGEAKFELGSRSLIFLLKSNADVLLVSGAAQGHFPVAPPDQAKAQPKLRTSPSIGKLVQRRGPSITVQQSLVGRALNDAVTKIRTTKATRDAMRENNRR